MSLPKVVILSSSMISDRMIMYNDFLKTLHTKADIYIWASASDMPAYTSFKMENVTVEKFPKTKEMRLWRVLLRRLVDYSWDAKKLTKSRRSFWIHTRIDNIDGYQKIIYRLGKVVNFFGLAGLLESMAEKVFEAETRSPEAYQRLQDLKPDLVVAMGPHFSTDPGVVTEVRKLKIKTAAFVLSWDNITTKNRLMFSYDTFILWSTQMKKDLDKIYPALKKQPSYIVGVPQYDMFFNERFYVTKEDFCRENGLDPMKPIILYALGSPNLFDEFPGAVEFVKRAAKGNMGDIQVIVRPHPLKHNDPELFKIKDLYKQVLIQTSNPKTDKTIFTHDTDQIKEWINTFRYADVVIQLGSTVSVDASLFDRPVINLGFDPSGKKNQLVWDLNHIMDHFAPITASGGLWEVNDYEEMETAVKGYLANPALHREGRKEIVKLVCEYSDGKSGIRYANAISDYLQKSKNN